MGGSNHQLVIWVWGGKKLDPKKHGKVGMSVDRSVLTLVFSEGFLVNSNHT